jgi:extracellular elastinolytic metalloproteinase
MRMFLWDFTQVQRDGALEVCRPSRPFFLSDAYSTSQNDIVVHEATHGITNRLTGGGTGRCLQVRPPPPPCFAAS